jgi:hypothetical protein
MIITPKNAFDCSKILCKQKRKLERWNIWQGKMCIIGPHQLEFKKTMGYQVLKHLGPTSLQNPQLIKMLFHMTRITMFLYQNSP